MKITIKREAIKNGECFEADNTMYLQTALGPVDLATGEVCTRTLRVTRKVKVTVHCDRIDTVPFVALDLLTAFSFAGKVYVKTDQRLACDILNKNVIAMGNTQVKHLKAELTIED